MYIQSLQKNEAPKGQGLEQTKPVQKSNQAFEWLLQQQLLGANREAPAPKQVEKPEFHKTKEQVKVQKKIEQPPAKLKATEKPEIAEKAKPMQEEAVHNSTHTQPKEVEKNEPTQSTNTLQTVEKPMGHPIDEAHSQPFEILKLQQHLDQPSLQQPIQNPNTEIPKDAFSYKNDASQKILAMAPLEQVPEHNFVQEAPIQPQALSQLQADYSLPSFETPQTKALEQSLPNQSLLLSPQVFAQFQNIVPKAFNPESLGGNLQSKVQWPAFETSPQFAPFVSEWPKSLEALNTKFKMLENQINQLKQNGLQNVNISWETPKDNTQMQFSQNFTPLPEQGGFHYAMQSQMNSQSPGYATQLLNENQPVLAQQQQQVALQKPQVTQNLEANPLPQVQTQILPEPLTMPAQNPTGQNQNLEMNSQAAQQIIGKQVQQNVQQTPIHQLNPMAKAANPMQSLEPKALNPNNQKTNTISKTSQNTVPLEGESLQTLNAKPVKTAKKLQPTGYLRKQTFQRIQSAAEQIQAKGGGKATLVLQDKDMGKIKVTMNVSSQNNVYIDVQAQDAKMVKALNEGPAELENALKSQGFQLAEFKAESASGSQQQGQNQNPFNGQQNQQGSRNSHSQHQEQQTAYQQPEPSSEQKQPANNNPAQRNNAKGTVNIGA